MNREQARIIIENLVERFAEHRKEYHLPDYNEQKTRQDFINPFFKALGWDIDNEKGASEAYREVIYEDKVIVKGKAKAPDYGFRLAGSASKRLFYVEAKKPSVPLKTNKEAAYQLRRYGSSAQALVSILTNFEDFIIYDCSKVPNLNDSATVARLKHISFEDYIKEFDFIYDTFSHEAVTKGRFDKFIQSGATKKGTDTLDKRFVESLDQWRKYLATSIALNNRKINDEELNFAVQLTIDRLIFLRFCEDRAVEPYGRLQKAVSKGDGYKNLFELFRQADDKYNSGLFDFDKDTITSKLKVDNKVIKYVIEELYYPKCNYEFSVMPVEIIGNAYEQFLGKVIRITPSRGVKIEEKPEVRKAGGVFYTPQYIVEYIVKNTVGKLIDGKTPKDIEKIKIVDPACGSGSFLIGAYHYLLDFHLDYYYNEQKRLTKTLENTNIALKEKNQAIKDKGLLPLTPDGKLTTKIKKQILVNNIFGVDLDANAVEVTKLSLLLKCMEGETEASIKTITLNLNDRVLPNLDSNIKDGNSLIDTDFYDSKMDLGYERKIKPFSWKKGFSEIFKQGGFDAVIGNPPYVRQELLDNTQKQYFENKYNVYHGVADLYSYFFEKGIDLLRENGLFGIIVANKWMRANYGEPLRKWLKNQNIKEIIDFGDLPVFQDITTYPCIIIAGKGKVEKKMNVTKVTTLKFERLEKYIAENKLELEQKSLNDNGWNLGTELQQNLLSKIQNAGIPFKSYINKQLFIGLKTGLNEAFILSKEQGEILLKQNKELKEFIKPYIVGRDIKKFQPLSSSKYLILIKSGWSKKNNIKNWQEFEKKLPKIAALLYPYEAKAKKRTDQGDFWWELRSCDYYSVFESEKILFAEIATEGQFTLDSNLNYCDMTGFIIGSNSKYLLGILNSKLTTFFFSKISSEIRGGFLRWKRQYVEQIPIVVPSSKAKKNIHNEIISNVELLLKLNKEIKEVKLQSKIEQIKQRIEHSEDKINQLIYDLYDLNEGDIKIIEEAISKK